MKCKKDCKHWEVCILPWVNDATCDQFKEAEATKPGPLGSAVLPGSVACGWVPGDTDSDCYETGCGESFVIYEGTPKENSMMFCCFCGKKIAT